MKSVSLEANLGGGWGLSSFLSPSLNGRSLDMTEILLTWTLRLNQSNIKSEGYLSVSSLCLLFAPVPVVSLGSPVDVDGCGSTIT